MLNLGEKGKINVLS